MGKALAERQSNVVKDAWDIKLDADMLKHLMEIDEGVRYAHELADRASSIKVTDEGTNNQAATVIIELSNTQKALEGLRKIFTSPLYDRKKIVDDAFKRWLGEPSRQEQRLRDEAGAWFMAKKRQAEKEAEEARKKQEEAERKARQTGKALPKLIAVAVEQPLATTRTDAGTLNVRTKKIGILVDINLVPRQYLMLNDRAVTAAINDGCIAAIPGIKIEEVPVTSAR